MKLRPDRQFQRGTEEETVFRRLSREADTCTVSYTRDDGEHVTRVGRGPSLDARVAAADAQLPPGEWTRVAVSTPTSVYGDLIGRPRDSRMNKRNNDQGAPVYAKYERKTVRVQATEGTEAGHGPGSIPCAADVVASP